MIKEIIGKKMITKGYIICLKMLKHGKNKKNLRGK